INFPNDPYAQLEGAIKAVFQSWQNDRANLYRRLNNSPAEWGTAVNVQAMVFGNKGNDSATGVCFTRDPASGENVFYGEFLVNAQGEDVVAGIRTPQKIEALGKILPEAYKQLLDIRKKLEKHYKDMQDIEFTVENKKLYMLQCRNGKRTGFAGVRIAVEMVEEKLIPKEEALRRVEPEALNQLLRPVFLPAAKKAAIEGGRLLAKGLPAGPGAATGKVVFFADAARRLRVRANADQPDQSEAAVAFGAEGIGLCRTEHMFFGEGKIGPMREMIVAETEAARRKALDKLLPLQREDFAGIFRAMKGRPVTI